jgi:hypothetical protein
MILVSSKILVVIAAAVLVFAPSKGTKFGPFGTAEAESGEPKVLNLKDTMELMRADMDTKKKTIIARSMEMTEPESEVFWPLYRDWKSSIDAA